MIEEIESVGRSALDVVASHLEQALAHALKIAVIPDSRAVRDWRHEVLPQLDRARKKFKPSWNQRIELAEDISATALVARFAQHTADPKRG